METESASYKEMEPVGLISFKALPTQMGQGPLHQDPRQCVGSPSRCARTLQALSPLQTPSLPVSHLGLASLCAVSHNGFYYSSLNRPRHWGSNVIYYLVLTAFHT